MDLAALVNELKRDEAVRLKPYRDTVGKLTIGVGRNLDDVGITAAEADHLLANDIVRVQADLDRSLFWWRSMNEVRQRVICNLCFNMGLGTLLTFHQTLAAMRNGEWKRAADGMRNSLWAKQVGIRAERLAMMMEKGTV